MGTDYYFSKVEKTQLSQFQFSSSSPFFLKKMDDSEANTGNIYMVMNVSLRKTIQLPNKFYHTVKGIQNNS